MSTQQRSGKNLKNENEQLRQQVARLEAEKGELGKEITDSKKYLKITATASSNLLREISGFMADILQASSLCLDDDDCKNENVAISCAEPDEWVNAKREILKPLNADHLRNGRVLSTVFEDDSAQDENVYSSPDSASNHSANDSLPNYVTSRNKLKSQERSFHCQDGVSDETAREESHPERKTSPKRRKKHKASPNKTLLKQRAVTMPVLEQLVNVRPKRTVRPQNFQEPSLRKKMRRD